mmetsp:Transcript_36294/g.43847  ORF Transcript_36294/g.43847 Transcript_36294/m.43847 type:complete len:239 (+) Transcript_36294:441-1157(+)
MQTFVCHVCILWNIHVPHRLLLGTTAPPVHWLNLTKFKPRGKQLLLWPVAHQPPPLLPLPISIPILPVRIRQFVSVHQPRSLHGICLNLRHHHHHLSPQRSLTHISRSRSSHRIKAQHINPVIQPKSLQHLGTTPRLSTHQCSQWRDNLRSSRGRQHRKQRQPSLGVLAILHIRIHHQPLLRARKRHLEVEIPILRGQGHAHIRVVHKVRVHHLTLKVRCNVRIQIQVHLANHVLDGV